MNENNRLKQFTLDARRTEPDYANIIPRLKDPHTIRLLHAAMGMATEAAEFLDMLKRHIFYGKEIDKTNAIEEIGDSSWYERIACDELNVEYIEMIAINVAKLKTRFPAKFNELEAINRNLILERETLEDSQNEKINS